MDWISLSDGPLLLSDCPYDRETAPDFPSPDTTRAPKGYEESGREYYFISRETFGNMVYNNRYNWTMSNGCNTLNALRSCSYTKYTHLFMSFD